VKNRIRGKGSSFALTFFRASLVYFLGVFAAGFILGTIRVLALAEAIGESNAELVEMPLMALVCGLAAYYLVRYFEPLLSPARALVIGILSLSMLLAVEFTVVLTLRGLSIREYIASRDLITGTSYALSLVWFAIAPLVIFVIRSKRNR